MKNNRKKILNTHMAKWKPICWIIALFLLFCLGHLLKTSVISGKPLFSQENLEYLMLFLIVILPIAYLLSSDVSDEDSEPKNQNKDSDGKEQN